MFCGIQRPLPPDASSLVVTTKNISRPCQSRSLLRTLAWLRSSCLPLLTSEKERRILLAWGCALLGSGRTPPGGTGEGVNTRPGNSASPASWAWPLLLCSHLSPPPASLCGSQRSSQSLPLKPPEDEAQGPLTVIETVLPALDGVLTPLLLSHPLLSLPDVEPARVLASRGRTPLCLCSHHLLPSPLVSPSLPGATSSNEVLWPSHPAGLAWPPARTSMNRQVHERMICFSS